MNAPILSRSCPLQSSKIVGDAPRFFCSTCRKDVVNLSLLSPDELQRLFATSKNGEICGLWLIGSNEQLLYGEKARASLRRLVATGILAASISGSLLQAGGQVEKERIVPETKAADSKVGTKECESGLAAEDDVQFLVGSVEFEVVENDLVSKSAEKNSAWKYRSKPINFHKKK